MSNRTSILFALLGAIAIVASPIAASAQQDRDMELTVGEQATVSAVGVERFSEGAPNIVDVRVTEREFVLVALRPGQTSLVLFYENGRRVTYNIVVRDPNAQETARPGSVEERENIRLDLYFVELNETYNHQIGIGFPGSIGGQGVGQANLAFDFLGTPMDPTPSFTTASLQLINQALPRIDIAQNQGWARLRRQAMVVTANGTPARFDSGGEVNFLVTGVGAARLVTVQFGSELRMTPRFDAQSGRIEIQIEADLSELTNPYTAGGPPGRRRTRLNSVVNLQPGQAMLMSGVVSRSELEAQGGLPGLSQIPIIGVLFGTNDRRGEATHSVVFVVPTIVQSVPRAERNYLRESLETFSRFSGFIHDYEMFEREPPGYGQPGGRAPERSRSAPTSQ